MTTTGPAEMTLVQLSDTHLRPAGELMHDRVDTYALLEAAVSTLAAATGPVDALLLTGDLADTGSPAAYRRLRDLVEPLAAALGAET
nr:metallophosphoesterase [Micromonospora sp. DSM 115978]